MSPGISFYTLGAAWAKVKPNCFVDLSADGINYGTSRTSFLLSTLCIVNTFSRIQKIAKIFWITTLEELIDYIVDVWNTECHSTGN